MQFRKCKRVKCSRSGGGVGHDGSGLVIDTDTFDAIQGQLKRFHSEEKFLLKPVDTVQTAI